VNEPFWSNFIWWAYAFVWLPFAACTALYAVRSPWRALPIGRALMTLLGSLTAVLSFVLFVMAVPIPREVMDVLRGLTLGSVGLAGWMLLRQIAVIQNNQPPDPCPKRRSTDVP
jgi:ABC-type Co2+ transport system permease subunit